MDTVVVGGSAGSLKNIRELFSSLPATFSATVLVCMHHPHSSGGRLPGLLQAHSQLKVVGAEEGLPLDPGTAIIATSDAHMMLGTDHVHLRRGPHENNFRPAIDPLFRSAAVYRGTRAVGVVLSGLLDDGAAGARALVRTGGRVLALSPETADYPQMPLATLTAVPEAEALSTQDIAERLAELCGSAAAPPKRVPSDIGIELKIAGLEGANMENEARLGSLSPYNCPHCNGVLWEIEDGPLVRYRCHTGHAYTIDSLSQAQEEMLDRALFDVLRAHKGRLSLLKKMARLTNNKTDRSMLETRATKLKEDTERLEDIIRSRQSQL